jgi:uncharacterized RDD family membrane protein YckC
VAPPLPASRASLARRLAAAGYETLLAAALVLVVGFLTAPLASSGPARQWLEIPGPTARTLSFCAVLVAMAAYFVWSWTGGRRTLAMKTWRMALVRADAGKVGARTAITRFAAAWIGPAAALAAYLLLAPAGLGAQAAWLLAVNYAWALVDPERQFLHDRIAGTRLVNG